MNKSEQVPANSLRENLTEFIKKDFPEFNQDCFASPHHCTAIERSTLKRIIEIIG